MGEKLVPTCDIFGTMQPKGLHTVRVRVTEEMPGDEPDRLLIDERKAVGTSGLNRVTRLAFAATNPPKKRAVSPPNIAATKAADGQTTGE